MVDCYVFENEDLTYEAKGLLGSMLSKPDNWAFYFSHFAEKGPSGKDKVRRMFHELIKFGYVVKREIRNQKGRFNTIEYIVHESPVKAIENTQNDTDLPKPEKPLLDKSVLDKSLTETPPLLSNHLTKIHNTNNTPNQDTIDQELIDQETTDQNSELIWPEKLSHADRESIHHLLVGVVDIEVNLKQLLLDELAGQLTWVNNPVGYFRTLLNNCHCGEFEPDKALKIQADRNKRKQNELMVERTQQYHDEQVRRKIQKYLKKQDG